MAQPLQPQRVPIGSFKSPTGVDVQVFISQPWFKSLSAIAAATSTGPITGAVSIEANPPFEPGDLVFMSGDTVLQRLTSVEKGKVLYDGGPGQPPFWADLPDIPPPTPPGVRLGDVNVFTQNQSVAPVEASVTGTYIPDASASNNFQFTLTGNFTLANPIGMTKGMVLNFCIDQDATGSHTITVGSFFKFPGGVTPTWVTTASAKNFISAYYDGAVLRCGSGAGYA